MDAVAALERRARRVGVIGRPPWWVADGRLYDLDVDEAMSVIRDCGRRSDEVLSALLDRSSADPEAGLVVLAALARLGLGRCHGDRARIDAFLGELVIAVAEARGGLIPPSRRRLAGVIVDRAWGRVRWAEAKGTRRFVVTDLSTFPERADPSALDAVNAAEVHVAVAQLRA